MYYCYVCDMYVHKTFPLLLSPLYQALKDWQLFCAVMCFIAVDVILIGLATSIKDLGFRPAYSEDKERNDIINVR